MPETLKRNQVLYSLNHMEEQLLDTIIDNLFAGRGQNSDYIAEMMEDEGLDYDTNQANFLLLAMKAIILDNKAKLVERFVKF